MNGGFTMRMFMVSHNKERPLVIYADRCFYTASVINPTEIFSHKLEGLYNDLSNNSNLFKDITYE